MAVADLTFALPVAALAAKIPTSGVPMGGQGLSLSLTGTVPVSAPATAFRSVTIDPVSPAEGEVWFRSDTKKISVFTAGAVVRSAALT